MNRIKRFFEYNKIIEIEEHSKYCITMTVTLISNDSQLTYTKCYDSYGITFEDVISMYKDYNTKGIIII